MFFLYSNCIKDCIGLGIVRSYLVVTSLCSIYWTKSSILRSLYLFIYLFVYVYINWWCCEDNSDQN